MHLGADEDARDGDKLGRRPLVKNGRKTPVHQIHTGGHGLVGDLDLRTHVEVRMSGHAQLAGGGSHR